jgi:hypothetical protein
VKGETVMEKKEILELVKSAFEEHPEIFVDYIKSKTIKGKLDFESVLAEVFSSLMDKAGINAFVVLEKPDDGVAIGGRISGEGVVHLIARLAQESPLPFALGIQVAMRPKTIPGHLEDDVTVH